MKIYRIYNKVTNKFSTGGCEPSFNKVGKTWTGTAAVKNHLRAVVDNIPRSIRYNDLGKWSSYNRENIDKYLNKIYRDCVLIEYEVENGLAISHDVVDFINGFFYTKYK